MEACLGVLDHSASLCSARFFPAGSSSVAVARRPAGLGFALRFARQWKHVLGTFPENGNVF